MPVVKATHLLCNEEAGRTQPWTCARGRGGSRSRCFQVRVSDTRRLPRHAESGGRKRMCAVALWPRWSPAGSAAHRLTSPITTEHLRALYHPIMPHVHPATLVLVMQAPVGDG